MRLLLLTIGTALVLTASALPAGAQVCGDANGDNLVNVTDGVQALRAAASLPSTCGEGCDIDASGDVSVTDGVNILRAVAGLSFTSACDFTGTEANEVVGPTFGIFGAFAKVPGVASGATAAGGPDCDNDGTVEVAPTTAQTIVTFTNCQIDNVVFDGTLGRITLGRGVVLGFQELRVTRVATGRSLTYSGQLEVVNGMEGRRLTGTLTVTSPQRGSFTIEYRRILIVAGGSARQGEIICDLTEAQGGRIAMIQLTFDDTDAIAVSVQLRTGEVKPFVLDRTTRILRPPL